MKEFNDKVKSKGEKRGFRKAEQSETASQADSKASYEPHPQEFGYKRRPNANTKPEVRPEKKREQQKMAQSQAQVKSQMKTSV